MNRAEHAQPGPLATVEPRALTGELVARWLPRAQALLPLAVCAVWAIAIDGIDVRDMSDLGLVSVTPAAVFVLLAVLTVSFAVAVVTGRSQWILLLHVLALIVMLYSITALVEQEPRFGTSWKHAGVIDYILRHHSVNPNIDAYFSWPGYFALGGVLTKLAGHSNAVSLTPWAPLAFNLLYLAPLIVIFRWASSDARVVWVATWVFYAANWVAQDYFSPQALAFMMWLAGAGALLTVFAPRPQALTTGGSVFGLRRPRVQRLRRWITQRTPPRLPGSATQRVGVLLLFLAIFSAMVTGHQLTPFPVLVAVTGLVLFARLEPRGLPIVMAFLLAAWISYMTTVYLAGNLGELVKPVGSVGQNLNESVGSRVGGSAGHDLIARIRVYASAAIWITAGAGALRRLLMGRRDAAMIVIGATPFLLPALQPYGGEILLRVYLYALPAVAFFAASLAFPSRGSGRGRWMALPLVIFGVALLSVFQYTRYGNERLDAYTPGDVAAVNALYKVAPPGSTVVAGDYNLPWRARNYETYNYALVTDLDAWGGTTDVAAMARELGTHWGRKGVYVIITRSTEVGEELLYERSQRLRRLAQLLLQWPSATTLYRGPDGYVFLVKPVGAAT